MRAESRDPRLRGCLPVRQRRLRAEPGGAGQLLIRPTAGGIECGEVAQVLRLELPRQHEQLADLVGQAGSTDRQIAGCDLVDCRGELSEHVFE